MNLDETSSPGAKRSRNHTKAHVGKLRKQAACEENDDEEEDEEGDWNGLDEDDVVGIGGMKSSSSSWQMQQQASRIFRVSRASGGKDRHSKVLTAKGLRDRRVRLSVSTAIQFYDLQGRLGYDQPSKAVDWLIKATTDAISELPSLDGTFPNNASLPKPNPPLSVSRKLARSACSSTSETTRASLLSLSRSETGVKAREQARDRTKEKKKVVTEKDKPLETNHPHHQTHSSSSSFAELLMNCNNQQNDNSSFVYKAPGKLSMVVKKLEHPSLQNTDYFSPNTISAVSPPGQASASKTNAMGLGQFANPAQLMSIVNSLAFGDHPELQQFAVSQDHHGSIATNSNDYSLDFSMSSFSADSNRGTLQSNSSVLLPHHHLQKFSSSIAASESATPGGMPFFIGAAQSADGQFPTGFDPRLQLCYNDGCRQSDLMGKERN